MIPSIHFHKQKEKYQDLGLKPVNPCEGTDEEEEEVPDARYEVI